jgi:hypothetical protein
MLPLRFVAASNSDGIASSPVWRWQIDRMRDHIEVLGESEPSRVSCTVCASNADGSCGPFQALLGHWRETANGRSTSVRRPDRHGEGEARADQGQHCRQRAERQTDQTAGLIESVVISGEPTAARALEISTSTHDRMIAKARREGLVEGVELPRPPSPQPQ